MRITQNFYLEFFRDLLVLLNKLEQEFRISHFQKKSKLIIKRSSELTLELYNKFHVILSLKSKHDEKGFNINLINFENKEVLIPYSFISSNFSVLKENYEKFPNLIEQTNSSWAYFQHYFCLIFDQCKTKIISVNINSLEKIRFFASFTNHFKHFIFSDPIPTKAKELIYNPIYAHWGSENNYYEYYKKLIKYNPKFVKNHIFHSYIPHYPLWKLKFNFIEIKSLNTQDKTILIEFYPLQVF